MIVKHKMRTETISNVYFKQTRLPETYSTESSSQNILELEKIREPLNQAEKKFCLAKKEGRFEDMLLILSDTYSYSPIIYFLVQFTILWNNPPHVKASSILLYLLSLLCGSAHKHVVFFIPYFFQ